MTDPLLAPTPDEVNTLRMSDGAVIELRRYARLHGPRIVVSHGNGLATDGYSPFWMPLMDHAEVVLFDMRNHGHNALHRLEDHRWPRFAMDIAEIMAGVRACYGERATLAALHSLSAIASVLRGLQGELWIEALVLFDPPFEPPENHRIASVARSEIADLVRRTKRRPVAYTDPSELAGQFMRHPAFARLVPGAAENLARTTLRHDAHTGQWVLRCPREFEALVFSSNADAACWSSLGGAFPVPLKLIGGDPDLEDSGAPPRICRALAEDTRIDYTMIPNTTHFLQLEQPQRCADEVMRFAAASGLLTG
ncbi:MAG: alpha/beta hydrolase [Pseudomonadota bacterium]